MQPYLLTPEWSEYTIFSKGFDCIFGGSIIPKAFFINPHGEFLVDFPYKITHFYKQKNINFYGKKYLINK